MREEKPNKRVQLNISKNGLKEIEELKESLNLTSMADVIRSSLKLAKYLQLERKAGNEIIIRDRKTNKEKEIVFM